MKHNDDLQFPERVLNDASKIITYHGREIRCVERDGVFTIRHDEGQPRIGEEITYRGTKKHILEVRDDIGTWSFRA